MIWLYLLSLICIVLGFVSGITGLRTLRSRTHPQAEITWQQSPVSPWRYETVSMIAIAIHSFGLACLMAFLAFSAAYNTTFTPELFTQAGWRLVLSVCAIIFTSYITGVVIAFHFAQQRIKPISYGIAEDGMWYGGSLIDWDTYSHHEVGPDEGQISLYSSYSPAIRTWVLRPPPESFRYVLGIIQQNLQSTQAYEKEIPWHHSPTMLVLAMTAMVLGGLLPAVWGLFHHQAWVWIYCLVAFFLVLSIGNQMITVFDGQRKSQTKKNP
jgi:hypothetical protein